MVLADGQDEFGSGSRVVATPARSTDGAQLPVDTGRHMAAASQMATWKDSPRRMSVYLVWAGWLFRCASKHGAGQKRGRCYSNPRSAGAVPIPTFGFAWAMETQAPGATLATLNNSGAFPLVDAKLASALSLSAIRSGSMMRAIHTMEEQSALEGKLMKIDRLFEVYARFRISEAEGSIVDFPDLMQVKLHDDQLVTLLNSLAYVLGAMQTLPPGNILESLFDQHAHLSQFLRDQIARAPRSLGVWSRRQELQVPCVCGPQAHRAEEKD